MPKKTKASAHWSYCVDAYQFLRCYRDKAQAVRVAKSRAPRSPGRVFVEKVRTNRAGVHNRYVKGAGVVWVSDK
jgi:hypothetical protein